MSSSTRSSSSRSSKIRRFTLAEIHKATDEFNPSRIIRTVEFGITFKGFLKDGQAVAVKRLDKESNVVDDFRQEIKILRNYKNDDFLVSLIGICEESQEMIVVHEFMHNGTLADHLSNKDCRFSWKRRLEICLDVARSLEFLHNQTATTTRIIHRNLNPTNIWLDKNWAAKISDFGYAKIGPANTIHSTVNTDVKGSSSSHLDPYYNLTGELTRRTDAYAFGVVLFEVLCWRHAFDGQLEQDQQMLGKWAQTCFDKGTLDTIVDARLKVLASQDCLNEFAILAYRCLHEDPKKRPKMSEIVEKLESLLTKSSQTRVSRRTLSTNDSGNGTSGSSSSSSRRRK